MRISPAAASAFRGRSMRQCGRNSSGCLRNKGTKDRIVWQPSSRSWRRNNGILRSAPSLQMAMIKAADSPNRAAASCGERAPARLRQPCPRTRNCCRRRQAAQSPFAEVRLGLSAPVLRRRRSPRSGRRALSTRRRASPRAGPGQEVRHLRNSSSRFRLIRRPMGLFFQRRLRSCWRGTPRDPGTATCLPEAWRPSSRRAFAWPRPAGPAARRGWSRLRTPPGRAKPARARISSRRQFGSLIRTVLKP